MMRARKNEDIKNILLGKKIVSSPSIPADCSQPMEVDTKRPKILKNSCISNRNLASAEVS